MGESRIHVLNNGRSPMKRDGDLVTLKEARQMVDAAVQLEREKNEKMVKWYMQQIPGLVAQMLGDALAMNGLTMKGPTSEQANESAGHTAVTGDAATSAQHADSSEPAADAGDGAVDLR